MANGRSASQSPGPARGNLPARTGARMSTKTWWTTSPARMSRRCAAAILLAAVAVAGSAAAQDRDFTPVTDAMLADPDPADWINWRRTLDGWGYSPLDQIDRDNVHRLGLVWSWTMTTGLSQPTPIVYDGVMYLPGPLNVVQALDAVTGDLLWEYRKRFERSPDDSFRARTPVDRHLRRQDLPEHQRRPHRRTRRPHRRRGLGPRGGRQPRSATATRAGRSSSTGRSSPA